mgnify:CR=1 FL=1
MAALKPPGLPVDGALSPPTRSFAAVVSSNSSMDSFDPGIFATHRRELAFHMSQHDIMKLAQPFYNALVGGFSYGRPPRYMVKKIFPH